VQERDAEDRLGLVEKGQKGVVEQDTAQQEGRRQALPGDTGGIHAAPQGNTAISDDIRNRAGRGNVPASFRRRSPRGQARGLDDSVRPREDDSPCARPQSGERDADGEAVADARARPSQPRPNRQGPSGSRVLPRATSIASTRSSSRQGLYRKA